jgi:hypothetical protein
MDVTTIGSTNMVSSATSSATQPSAVDDTLLPDATQTSISPEGDLFGQLADLAKTDPAKFKKAAAEISEKLKDEAGSATGKKAEFLTKLADRFDEAARTGDVSALKPQGTDGPHKHGHHHHGSSGATPDGSQASPFQSLAQVISAALQDVDPSTSSSSTAASASTASGA